MKMNKLIESIGLSSEEVKPYLLEEIEEFLNADNRETQLAEFHDILFSLKNLVYAHTGEHLDIDEKICEKKTEQRLKKYGTISKKKPKFSHVVISKIPIGVVHISFGNFKQPWTQFDPFKNGTEAEIAALTDNEFKKDNNYTNHLIVTFDNVDEIEYSFLTSSWNENEKNTLICRIPDFIYQRAKKNNYLDEVEALLSLQVYAALTELNILNEAIFHFHSWESAVSIKSQEFNDLLKGKDTLFSPYLTVTRLKKLLDNNKKHEATLNTTELDISSKYELELITFCDSTIVESDNDRSFYEDIGGNKIKKYSYSESKEFVIPNNGLINDELTFVSGGRPVFEKGFIELITEVPELVKFARSKNVRFHLKIFCKEYDRQTGELKKKEYLKELDRLIEKLNLKSYVAILDKVSINKLREEIKHSCGLIIPSLYDPYCLMPHYAIDVKRISFVSTYTGISESIDSKEYLFNPTEKGSLVKAMHLWYDSNNEFILRNNNRSYKHIYKDLDKD
jgi:glycosyltransferase involved in cell wall biosynthesis